MIFTDEIALKFADEYVDYLQTGVKSATLLRLTQQLASSHSKKDIFTQDTSELGAGDQFFVCTTCRAALNVVARMFLTPDGELNGENAEEDTKKAMLEICDTLNIQTEEVCSGLFDLNWPIIHHVMHNTNADSRSVCGTLPIKMCKVKQEQFNWELKIEGSILEEAKSEKPTKTANDLNILQLTDIHYDVDYKVGSLADCAEPMCCNRDAGSNAAQSSLAGFWTDYRDCDSPIHMIEDAFDHIVKTHTNIDYIYQTGDIPAHNIWSSTIEENKESLTTINELIQEKFDNIPVYSCVGNHEPSPANV